MTDLDTRNKELSDASENYRQQTAAAEEAKQQAEDDRARLEGDVSRLEDSVSELERQLTALSGERDNLVAEREALIAQGVPVTEIIGNTVALIEGKVSDVGPGFVV